MHVAHNTVPARQRLAAASAALDGGGQRHSPAKARAQLRRSAVIAAILAVVGVGMLASPANAARTIGKSFAGNLLPDQQIANNGYRFIMQRDGNLVLYNGKNRACWASGTYGLNGTHADYSGDWVLGNPYLTLQAWFGELRRYNGQWNRTPSFPTNVSINSRGEVWIAYKKFVSC